MTAMNHAAKKVRSMIEDEMKAEEKKKLEQQRKQKTGRKRRR